MYNWIKGKKYPERMVELLRQDSPEVKRVLDLGSGDGSWYAFSTYAQHSRA